jgi:hypothetical protein
MNGSSRAGTFGEAMNLGILLHGMRLAGLAKKNVNKTGVCGISPRED